MLAPGFASDPDPYFVDRDADVNLNNRILTSVAFLGIKKNGRFQPRGTAFFVGYIQDQHRFDHLVTAEHVVSMLLSSGHEIWLRANLKSGAAAEFHIESTSFRFHPDNEKESTDVAVCPFNRTFTDEGTGELIEIDAAPLWLVEGPQGFLPSADFSENFIGLGAEVAIVGLFRSHYGQNRNIPIVRVGNISALPSEPIKTDYTGYIKAYLIEARSIAGLSGSPVIVMPDTAVTLARGLGGDWPQGAALLGLMHGHFDVQNLNEDVVADADSPSRSVHTGIGIVVPVEKIVETINHPELVAMRKEIVSNTRKSGGATADLATDETEASPPATDANPTHREDFMRLVGAAARKREPED